MTSAVVKGRTVSRRGHPELYRAYSPLCTKEYAVFIGWIRRHPQSHVFYACEPAPRTVPSTRLADLVNTMDPTLVAVAFSRDPEAAMIYLADHIDNVRTCPSA